MGTETDSMLSMMGFPEEKIAAVHAALGDCDVSAALEWLERNPSGAAPAPEPTEEERKAAMLAAREEEAKRRFEAERIRAQKEAALQKKLEERRAQRVIEEREAAKQKELARRAEGQHMQAAKETFEEEQLRREREEMQRKKREEAAYKKALIEKINRQKEERKLNNGLLPATQPQEAPVVPRVSAATGLVTVRVKPASGAAPVTHLFEPGDDHIEDLAHRLVEDGLVHSVKKISLVGPPGRTRYTFADASKRLGDLGSRIAFTLEDE